MQNDRPTQFANRYVREFLAFSTWAFVFLLVAAVVVLGINTVDSHYRGEHWEARPVANSASATVGECDRVGPVSVYGFGYWWRCRATVVFSDGRQVETTVAPSIVTPDDAGNPVTMVERCSATYEDCVYTRPGNRVVAVGIRFLRFVRNAVLALGVLFAGVSLVRGLLGWRVFARLGWLPRDQMRKRPSMTGPNGVEIGERMAVSDHDAWPQGIEIRFSYPSGPFNPVYESTKPRLLVDSREQFVPGWGVHYFPVPAGMHSLQVTIPFGTEEFAAAEYTLTVAAGVRSVLDYRAPRALAFTGVLQEVPAGER